MTLYMIGLGLYDLADITLRGLEIIRRCDVIYLEQYTAILHTGVGDLESFFQKKIVVASREFVESKGDIIVEQARNKNVAFLVVGDPFGATTHTDLFLRARKVKVSIEVVHNASIISAVGVVGLELYKYGRTTSIVFPDDGWLPGTPLQVIHKNLSAGLHTLCLLDIKVSEPSKQDLLKGVNNPLPPRFMTINQALETLIQLEKQAGYKVFDKHKLLVGVARLGACNGEPIIVAGTVQELLAQDFGPPMHSLIIPSDDLHHIEKDMLDQWVLSTQKVVPERKTSSTTESKSL
jgi:diphthine methyl ester synthase